MPDESRNVGGDGEFNGGVLRDQKLTLLGDGPQTVDLLGYQPYVDAMVQVFAQEDLQTPFAVGVFGRWGTGKSTFMKLLEKELSKTLRAKANKKGGFHTVWFEPWQFEQKEDVWKALLLSVIRYLETVEADRHTHGEQEAARIKQTLANLALSVGKLALNKTVQAFTSGTVDLNKILQAYAETARDNSRFINTFREEFGRLKDEILYEDGNEKSRLFIFVDDLDRCTPDNCIMVLEAVKLFFDLPECIFVLGIDREVVQRGIEEKYQRSPGISGQEYIEKLIQLPFSLPAIRHDAFTKYVDSITQDFDFEEKIRKLIGQAAEGNPRRAKRLSNCLQLTRTVADTLVGPQEEKAIKGLGDEADEAKLALLLTLQVRYPIAYLWLTQNPITMSDLDEGWETLSTVENGSDIPGYRDQLVRFLRDVYGDRVAEHNADGFLRLWRKAHGTGIGVGEFRDSGQLKAYMRITGLVDDERVRSLKPEDFPTGRAASRQYLAEGEELSTPSASDPNEAELEDRPEDIKEKERNEKERNKEHEELLSQAEKIRDKWDAFKNVGVLRCTYALASLPKRAEKIPEDAEVLVERINRYLGVSEIAVDSHYQLRGLRGQLSTVSREKAYRHVKSVAGMFALLWPICMGLFGTAVEFGAGALVSLRNETFVPQGEVTGGSWLRDWAVGLIEKYNGHALLSGLEEAPLRTLVDIPAYFPGGELFFWAAVIYGIIGAVVWRIAVTVLKRLKQAQT